MAKSGRRNKAEGTLDKVAGRALEVWGRLTGNTKARAKGKGARARGAARRGTGRLKRSAR
jgi:uncharacterized protein YjbJ (UPF0337 family)